MDMILIVDADQTDPSNYIDLLSQKYDIISADTVEEAISILQEKFKLLSAVILSTQYSDFKKYELLKQKQKNILLSHIPTILISEDADVINRIKDDSLCVSDFVFRPLNYDDLTQCIDKNIKKYHDMSLLRFIQFDRLTGLYNRDSFFELAEDMINEHNPGFYSLSCFDIETFKVINDQYGTDTGDFILKHIANCINKLAIKCGGLCCRISGDNFAMLSPLSDADICEIETTNNEASSPACINQKIRIRTGIFIVDDLSLPVSVMYDRAVMACESIKGRYDAPCIKEYDESMRLEIVHEQEIVNCMYQALEKGQFEPWLQPQYNHFTGAMIGAEALVRWKKDNSFVSPAQFVPVFEKNGFIYEMDKYMWNAVCKLLRCWTDSGLSPLPVSVNISRRDLFHNDCITYLDSLVKKYALPYDLLRLEVTESAFSESSKMIVTKVNELIDLGFTVEIDDFGSGYSSLNTLKDVPASILKLDMKFLDNTANTQRGGNIIESVVRMAKWLGMAVIAEGVEHIEQADYLKSIGCHYIQGYLYSKPIPVCEYENLMKQRTGEHKLSKLKTLASLNNNEFWNPKSMETLIFNSYIGGVCIFEYYKGKTELLRVNEQYSLELGYFKPVGTSLYDNNIELYLDEENKKAMLNNINNAIKTKSQSSCMLVLSDKESHTEYIRSILRVIAQADDRYLLYCVIVNISELIKANEMRLEAEKRESKSAQRLNMIMQNINGGVSAMIIDDNGHSECLFTNDNFYRLFGYTKEQATGEDLDVMSLIHPDDFPKVIEIIKKLKDNGIPVVAEFRCRKKDGHTIYLRANLSLMIIDEVKSDIISSVISDITDEKSAINNLMLLTDNIPGGLAKFEFKNDFIKIIYLSEGVFKLTGYSRDELMRLSKGNALFLVSEKDAQMLISTLHTMISTGENMDFNFRAKLKNGELRWVNIRSSIGEVNEDATIINVVFLDIMEQKSAEDRLLQNQYEITQKYEYVQQLRDELLENSLFSYTINLTKEVIEEYNSKIDIAIGSGSMLHFTESLTELILSSIIDEDRDTVKNTFFPKSLLKSYKQNKTKITIEYQRKINDTEYHWIRTSATIVKHPDTNEIIAFLYAKDIDTEKKNQLAVKSIINKEIDAISLINVKSGLQHIIISKSDLRMVTKDQTFDHDEMIIKKLNCCNFLKEEKDSIKEMLLKNLTDKLNKDGYFTMRYNITRPDGKKECKRTYAYYLDETHENIIMSERNNKTFSVCDPL